MYKVNINFDEASREWNKNKTKKSVKVPIVPKVPIVQLKQKQKQKTAGEWETIESPYH